LTMCLVSRTESNGQASAESVQPQRRLVLVHVRGGGKTKMIQCEAQSTVRAMREAMSVSLDEVVLLIPGRRELDDEMWLGEIARKGPVTVEVRRRGVGGGGAEDEAFREVAGKGNVDEVRRLLAVGANVNAKDGLGLTPLHMSARNGHVEVSQMLVGAGANLDAPNNRVNSPLLSLNKRKKERYTEIEDE